MQIFSQEFILCLVYKCFGPVITISSSFIKEKTFTKEVAHVGLIK